jgi:hypothetical protein
MIAPSRTFVSRFALGVALAAACLGCLVQAGCLMQYLRGPGYRDELQPLGQQMRPDASKHDWWGFDRRSRQTEENLGK